MVEPGKSDWIDISVPIRNGMVHWPDDPPVVIERVSDMERGDVATVSRISMCAHTGTHIDAPLHFIRGAESVARMPFEATVGRARIIEIRDPESIKPQELKPYNLQPGERILFKTMNSFRCWKTDDFVGNFVFISQEAARLISETRVRMVGVDYLSVGGLETDGPEIHRILLRGGVWIIEGLNLEEVIPGEVDLVCLPLRMEGGDGAPARAIVKPV